jgi:hypothetical protein
MEDDGKKGDERRLIPCLSPESLWFSSRSRGQDITQRMADWYG